jgi:hypothetical protein
MNEGGTKRISVLDSRQDVSPGSNPLDSGPCRYCVVSDRGKVGRKSTFERNPGLVMNGVTSESNIGFAPPLPVGALV